MALPLGPRKLGLGIFCALPFCGLIAEIGALPDAIEAPGHSGSSSIEVAVVTIPTDATYEFSLVGDVSGTLTHGQSLIRTGLGPGVYSSQELLPGNWRLDSIVCSDASSSGDLASATATMPVGASTSTTCTFTNVWPVVFGDGFETGDLREWSSSTGGPGACLHSPCETGDPLAASCNGCVAAVCAVDPFCCQTSWDTACQGQVTSVCGLTCPTPHCTHDPCVEGPALSASCSSCTAAVCALDADCCGSQWDALCTAAVPSACGFSCPASGQAQPAIP